MSWNGQLYRSKRRLSQHEADSTDLPISRLVVLR
jgi:hypothetical protein